MSEKMAYFEKKHLIYYWSALFIICKNKNYKNVQNIVQHFFSSTVFIEWLKKNRQPHKNRDINQESYKDQLQKCGSNK